MLLTRGLYAERQARKELRTGIEERAITVAKTTATGPLPRLYPLPVHTGALDTRVVVDAVIPLVLEVVPAPRPPF